VADDGDEEAKQQLLTITSWTTVPQHGAAGATYVNPSSVAGRYGAACHDRGICGYKHEGADKAEPMARSKKFAPQAEAGAE
jgi:hypothetical protein